MHARAILWIVVAAVAAQSHASGRPAPGGQGESLSRGLHERVLRLEDGEAIRYSLAVPELEPGRTVDISAIGP